VSRLQSVLAEELLLASEPLTVLLEMVGLVATLEVPLLAAHRYKFTTEFLHQEGFIEIPPNVFVIGELLLTFCMNYNELQRFTTHISCFTFHDNSIDITCGKM
jgi:hypothetical protein